MNRVGGGDAVDTEEPESRTVPPAPSRRAATAVVTAEAPAREWRGRQQPVPPAGEARRPPRRRRRMPAALVLLRPRQWIKNIFVLVAPLALDPAALLRHPGKAAAAVVAFTAASAAVYVLNDWLDRERDRLHPVKRHRPLAGGRIGPFGAALLGLTCLAALAVSASFLPGEAQAAIAGYGVINLAYCLALKHHALVDVSLVASGFVLRAVAGCVAVAAPFNPALIICVYCTCLLLSLGKRRHELAAAELLGQASAQRPALAGYSVPLLDQLMTLLLAATLISYEMFVLSASHPHAAVLAVATVPFAVFAVCRYVQMVAVRSSGGEPGRDVLTDVPLVINAVLWLACLAAGRLL
ncbi:MULTISPECIES: UbiA prenyltransferase family protein [Streptomyces]|uniref:UbiA prenyltransferase family protein n=1 Tax=Streptomyces glycanivorans TaxID=3033808 RepID=A0ABY9JJN2_9ACTN|nr:MULTISPECIES: UbiA prenyltransferase family protein [unclassified Streptomyces]WSQ79719.1 UbiA prenyltransferase family protein [Streptomyces sp. NBC_01213]TXS15755.1 prenyltransferase [Streptomyces sp. wa22]WLQ66271.1 UbiA prenyltransferase family protein [Streptomyces sp. Alt3]WSQ87099.1 UbiA prenyltransferase family protein [Streptomyces sp. NBC_01212]WSR06885.1 UbiA prenyltransferase family protein [Streptomyces sp. NBC_01208]